MTPTPDDYERLAARLDGQDVPLTAAQQAMLEEVLADERALRGRLDVPAPPGLLHRVHARCAASRRRPRARLVAWMASAAAVAAAGILAVALHGHRPPPPSAPAPGAVAAIQREARLLAVELDNYERIWASDSPLEVALTLQAVQEPEDPWGLSPAPAARTQPVGG